MIRKVLISAAMICIATLASGQTWIRQGGKAYTNAELYGNFVTGDFRASYEAASAFTVGAKASGLKHEKNFSMAGTFGFEQMEGEGMAGSMFIKQGFYPINVYEFTPGHKTLQTYTMSGGLSVDIAPNWRIGGLVQFESANYAKRKDLRYTNYRLDMTVSPGVQYHEGRFSAGLSYIFSKNSESISAEQIGANSSGYEAFFDKGLYYGVNEIWTGSGVHLKESGVSGLPVSENIHGVGAQLRWGDAWMDAQWRARSGKAGEKQTIWYRFPGWDTNIAGGYTLRGTSATHIFKGSLNYLSQDNWETILDKETEGGITLTHEYGANLIYSRRNMNARMEYTLQTAKWDAGARLMFVQNKGRASLMYPYIMTENLKAPAVEVFGSVLTGKIRSTLAVHYGRGTLNNATRNVGLTAGAVTEPLRLERYFVRYQEHVTCDQIWLMPAVRYTMQNGMYAELNGCIRQGFQIVELPGSWRAQCGVKLGYNF